MLALSVHYDMISFYPWVWLHALSPFVLLALLALSHHVRFSCDWLHLCIFILLMHVSLLVCSCHQALLQILILCSFMPIYIHGILSPSIGTLLVATCIVHNSIQWFYEHQIQTYICPLRTLFSLISCLYVHLLSFFACILACSLPLLVFSICMFFAIFFLST